MNLNPKAQSSLLKYAMNKPEAGTKTDQDEMSDNSDEDAQMDVSKFESRKKKKEEIRKKVNMLEKFFLLQSKATYMILVKTLLV